MTVRSKTTKLLLLDSLLQERMAVLSTLLSKRLGTVVTQAKRSMGGMSVRQMPSRWHMDKFKDDLHFYFLLAAIPLTLFTAYINITVGEAKLVPIPEGYKPKEHEYYKNPISRLMVKYCKPFGLQQEYEMNMHGVWEGVKIAEMRALKKEVHRQMQIHGDYKGWYHREDIAKYARIQREGDRLNTEQRGSHFVGHDHSPK